jgi:hypothetical protein
LLLNGQAHGEGQGVAARGEVFQFDCDVPSGTVRATVTINQETIEGEFIIRLWTDEGVRRGVKVKGTNPPVPEIKISNEDLESGKATILLS